MTDNYLDISICRFCHDGGTVAKPLISPCGCSGSVASVHRECLEEWVARSRNLVCELCGTPYAMRTSPVWKVSLRGCFCLLCDMSCSITFQEGLFTLGYLLFFCTWMNVQPEYFVGLAVCVNLASFALLASASCGVVTDVIDLTFVQQRALRFIKNRLYPTAMLTMVPIMTLQVVATQIPSLDCGDMSVGCLVALVTYSWLSVVSVLFSYCVRLDDQDRGPPRCDRLARQCRRMCRRLRLHEIREWWHEIRNGCTIFTCCFERHVAFGQFMFIVLRPYPSEWCDYDDAVCYCSSKCVKVDLACGLVWSLVLLGILAYASRVGDAARDRLRPDNATAQLLAQALWTGIILIQILALCKQLVLVGSAPSTCAIMVIWAVTWTLQNALLVSSCMFIHGGGLSMYMQDAWHTVSWAFRARSEFCDVAVANADIHSRPLEQPLVA